MSVAPVLRRVRRRLAGESAATGRADREDAGSRATPRPMKALAAAALLALALAAPASAAAPPKRGVLVPGRSLGGLRLGMTQGQVRAAWGSSFGRCRDCLRPTWYYNLRRFQPQGVGVQFRRGSVEAIFTVWSPKGWRTTKGLRIGDDVAR